MKFDMDDQVSWDDDASAEAIDNFNRIANRLETLIDQRDQDVKRAMADYTAQGVSDQYYAKEQHWHKAANEVREIISTLRKSLEESGNTANQAMTQASRVLAAIGISARTARSYKVSTEQVHAVVSATRYRATEITHIFGGVTGANISQVFKEIENSVQSSVITQALDSYVEDHRSVVASIVSTIENVTTATLNAVNALVSGDQQMANDISKAQSALDFDSARFK